MNRLNQVKRMAQMIQSIQSVNSISMLTFSGKSSILLTFFGKRSIPVTFCSGYFESLQLIQSYQSLKVSRLSHLLYENELTQSPNNSFGKGIESIQSMLQKKNRFKLIN